MTARNYRFFAAASSLLLLFAFLGCDRGTPFENTPPETSIFLSDIQLTGANRLNSVITIFWSGEDKDGYVVGYEVSTDNSIWGVTTATDSTFSFEIPGGQDTVDIPFYVRAVDNDGDVDPTAAFLEIPLKNREPVARFDTVSVLPDTVFSAGTVLFSVDDPDGNETLETIEIRLNGGPWYELPLNTRFISFLPENPEIVGQQNMSIFDGPSADELSVLMEGGIVGGNNQFHLRARDIAGIYSDVDSSGIFWLRQKRGNLLLVDDHSDEDADQVYREILNQVFPSFDVIDIRSDRPSIWDPTLGLILGVYDKVLWYSDGSDLPSLGQQLTLEVAATSLQEYLNAGGKLFVSAKFPATFNEPDQAGVSPVFDFSPMDSLSSSTGQARIPIDSLLNPVASVAGVLQPIVCGTFITGADPFYPKDPGNALFEANLIATGGWTGPSTIIAKTNFTNGETNQVFVGVELHKLDGDRVALQGFLEWVMNTAFNW